MLAAIKTLATNSDGNSALHLCTTKEEAEGLIGLWVDVNARNDCGSTPLHSASSRGYDEVVTALLAAGAKVDPRNDDGWTPLHWASRNGRLEVAEALIAAGADVNASDGDYMTPLHWASDDGNLEVVTLLLTAGANVHARNNSEWAPLHFACGCGHAQVATALMAAGAEVDAKSTESETPLSLCKTDEMRGLFEKKPETMKIIPLPSAIAPARTISFDEIRLFHAMLENAELIARAAVAQGDSGSGLRRATTLHETALSYVKQSVENLTIN